MKRRDFIKASPLAAALAAGLTILTGDAEAASTPAGRAAGRASSGASGTGKAPDWARYLKGTVTHFGHRHFRQNRYDSRVEVVPVDGNWKIRSIEVFDERRLR